jgi:hypothetical protein
MNERTNNCLSKDDFYAITELISRLILNYNHKSYAKMVDDFIYDLECEGSGLVE